MFKTRKEKQQRPSPTGNLGEDEFLVYIPFGHDNGRVPGP